MAALYYSTWLISYESLVDTCTNECIPAIGPYVDDEIRWMDALLSQRTLDMLLIMGQVDSSMFRPSPKTSSTIPHTSVSSEEPQKTPLHTRHPWRWIWMYMPKGTDHQPGHDLVLEICIYLLPVVEILVTLNQWNNTKRNNHSIR